MCWQDIGIHRGFSHLSKVDRSVLEKDGVRHAVRDSGYGHLLMSDEDVARSLAETMAGHRKGDPVRSEERRVGKECRSRWSPYH